MPLLCQPSAPLSNRVLVPVAQAAGLLALVLLCYLPAVYGGFVWDDVTITSLPALSAGWDGLYQLWFEPAKAYSSARAGEPHYWPVTYTSFWLDLRLWGESPTGLHVTNIVLHALCVLLLWLFLRTLAPAAALLAAALFAVHPLHAESVAWIMGRKDLLACLFSLCAAMSWWRWRCGGGGAWGAASLLCVAFAVLSKTIAIMVVATLPLLCWWQTGRFGRDDFNKWAPLLALAGALALVDIRRYWIAEGALFDLTLPERLLIAAHSIWFYVGKHLWPEPLHAIYPHWRIDPGAWLTLLKLWAVPGLVGLLWAARHRLGRGALAGWLFFLALLSPVLGVMDYGHMRFTFAADRYTYLAGIGLLVPAASLLGNAAILWSGKWVRLAGIYLAVAALIVWQAGLTRAQASLYQDNIIFFTHVLKHNSNALSAHLNMALTYHERGRRSEALRHAMMALKQQPRSEAAHKIYALSLLSVARGLTEEERKGLEGRIETTPRDPYIFRTLGNALALRGQWTGALLAYDMWVRAAPEGTDDHAAAVGSRNTAWSVVYGTGRARQGQESSTAD